MYWTKLVWQNVFSKIWETEILFPSKFDSFQISVRSVFSKLKLKIQIFSLPDSHVTSIRSSTEIFSYNSMDITLKIGRRKECF